MKKLVFLIVLGFLISVTACQHNDICTEDSPGTPRLVIKFYNETYPDELKPVEDFNARALNSAEDYFEEAITDTIVMLPLRVGEESTTYQLIIKQDDTIKENTDTLKLTYTTDDIYISRACGFKNVFNDFDYELLEEASDQNWIKAIEIPNENQINDEETTHLAIYH